MGWWLGTILTKTRLTNPIHQCYEHLVYCWTSRLKFQNKHNYNSCNIFKIIPTHKLMHMAAPPNNLQNCKLCRSKCQIVTTVCCLFWTEDEIMENALLVVNIPDDYLSLFPQGKEVVRYSQFSKTVSFCLFISNHVRFIYYIGGSKSKSRDEKWYRRVCFSSHKGQG